jgi:hypothetical protein
MNINTKTFQTGLAAVTLRLDIATTKKKIAWEKE